MEWKAYHDCHWYTGEGRMYSLVKYFRQREYIIYKNINKLDEEIIGRIPITYHPTPAEAQAEAEKFIRRRELEKRVGTMVKPGDVLPAGTEFSVSTASTPLRLDYENGIAEIYWMKFDGTKVPWRGARKFDEHTYKVNPDEIVVNPNLFNFYDLTITKIGSGAPEKEEEMEKEIWSEEQLKRFREAYDAATCQTEKDAIKRIAPEAFKVPLKLERGMLFLSPTLRYEAIVTLTRGEKGRLIISCLDDKMNIWNSQSVEDEIHKHNWRPMRSGTIILTVTNGKIASAKVNED